MSTNTNKFLRMENARTEEQRRLMEQIENDGVCPFCAEHFQKYHPKPILRETDSWYLTENMSPYPGTKYHFLYVYKKDHFTSIADLPLACRLDLFTLVDFTVQEYQIAGGAFFMRFGDTRFTGSSVEHLHAHLIVGDVDDPQHEPVRVKLG